eukprot:2917588-Pyramimonas_sp.AAC.1
MAARSLYCSSSSPLSLEYISDNSIDDAPDTLAPFMYVNARHVQFWRLLCPRRGSHTRRFRFWAGPL